MKKIINGKVYDTEKATEIGYFQNTGDRRDFYWYREGLYRKRTGEYFLHGEGGPATKYAEHVERNGWASGEKIIPMEYTEAKEWGERNLDTEEYEREFGEIVEDESTESVILSLPASTAAKFRRAAQEKGISLSALIASFAD